MKMKNVFLINKNGEFINLYLPLYLSCITTGHANHTPISKGRVAQAIFVGS